jgi:hypothetical protein
MYQVTCVGVGAGACLQCAVTVMPLAILSLVAWCLSQHFAEHFTTAVSALYNGQSRLLVELAAAKQTCLDRCFMAFLLLSTEN